MGNKGALDVVVDQPAINEIIVYANSYRQAVQEDIDTITSLCKKMTEDESLNGGDGEEIKANFNTIATGCITLEKSIKHIVDGLNANLESIIKMTKGTTTSESTQAAAQAASKLGTVRKE